MSIKLIARIMEEVDLPRPQTAILLAMAENAWDDGSHCFPSVDRIAWKAGYKYRQVINIIRQLESSGVIRKVEDAKRHRATEYHIDIDSAPQKLSFEDWKIANGRCKSRGAISQQEESRGAISQHLGVQSRNLGVQSIAPEPLEEPLEGTLSFGSDKSSPVAPPKSESPSIRVVDNSTPGVVVAEVDGETVVGVDPALTAEKPKRKSNLTEDEEAVFKIYLRQNGLEKAASFSRVRKEAKQLLGEAESSPEEIDSCMEWMRRQNPFWQGKVIQLASVQKALDEYRANITVPTKRAPEYLPQSVADIDWSNVNSDIRNKIYQEAGIYD